VSALSVARAMDILHQGVVVPDYELILQKAYRHFLRPGDTVVDVGANGGRHAYTFSWLVEGSGTVIAFEPIPELAQRLRDAMLVYPRREVREIALGREPGRSEFHYAPRNPGRAV
jgi:tRNA A58 N-methylase Trm61